MTADVPVFIVGFRHHVIRRVDAEKGEPQRHFHQTDVHPLRREPVQEGCVGRGLHLGAGVEDQCVRLPRAVEQPAVVRL